MEQIYNGVLQIMQTAVERTNTPAADRTGSEDTFRKLMDRRQAETMGAEPVQKTAVEPETAEAECEVQKAVLEEPEMQERMLLAAMALMQRPVVPVEPTLTAELPEGHEGSVQQVLDAVIPQESRTVQWFTEQPLENTVPQAADAALTEMNAEAADAAVQMEPQAKQSGNEGLTPAETLAQTTENTAAQNRMVTGAQQTESDSVEYGFQRHEEQPEAAEIPVFKDVQEIPVKVGEVSVTEATAAAEQVETQVVEKLTQALENGETRVKIQLTPENLGRVDVELTLSADGTLYVELRAENSQTRTLLEKSAEGLENLLARNTQQEVRVEIQHRHEEQQQDLRDGHQGNAHHHQSRQNRNRQYSEQDFLQQLRLGLIPLDEAAS